MIVSLRGRYRTLTLYGGAQAFILIAALQGGDRASWRIALPLMAAISLYAWIATFKRYRAVSDVPTSTVAAAAQGYVELIGRAHNHPGLDTLARLSNKPCCWFRYELEERDGENDWRTVDSGESASTFMLRDATGSCVIDPEGAEILCTNKERWYPQSGRRCTEWRIHDDDPLYVLGEFRTHSLVPDATAMRADIGALLAQWKREPRQLLRRFDLNGDGRLDLREWELARAEARREVAREHRALRAAGDIDLMQAPADGRLYLLSNYRPVALARFFALWSWLHLCLFFVTLTGFAFAVG